MNYSSRVAHELVAVRHIDSRFSLRVVNSKLHNVISNALLAGMTEILSEYISLNRSCSFMMQKAIRNPERNVSVPGSFTISLHPLIEREA